MSRSSSVRSIWWAAAVTGVVVTLVSALLIADGFAERGRAAAEAARVEALEARVPTEAEAAQELFRETEIQTERSLIRDRRNQRLGWVLLIVAIAFFGSAKGFQALEEEPRSRLVTIGRPARAEVRPPEVPDVSSLETAKAADSVDLIFVDRVIESEGRNQEAAIPILQALQSHYRYLPESALRRVCEHTDIAPSQIMGVASFYSQFRRNPVGRNLVRVCHGTACHVAGIEFIMDELRRQLQIPPDADTDAHRRFTLESVNCLGCCSLAPVLMVEEHVAGRLTPTSAWDALEIAEAER